jgi:hypothetical protein
MQQWQRDMAQRYEIIRIREEIHPQDASRIYLIQIAVDGQCCVPFWDSIVNRKRLGEDAWIQSLYENAEGLIREHGPAPYLS